MILQALVQYYESLLAEDKIPRQGWGKANVSFALDIDAEGNLLTLIPLKKTVQRGKKEVQVPQVLIVPAPKKKTSGVDPQFLCDNSSYFLGIDNKGKAVRTKQCFEKAAAYHQQVLADCPSVAAMAVKAFFKKWDPDKAAENSILSPYLEDLWSANFIFFVEHGYAQDDPAIMACWNQWQMQHKDAVVMQCLVTGKKAPIARLHPSIKGVRGAQSSGASLVSFNARAYESYGHVEDQGLNAPVSEYAAFAYSTALNYLLADGGHAKVIGDTTVVYWAESNSDVCQDIFAGLAFGDNQISDADLDELFLKIQQGQPFTYHDISIDYDNTFYVLGLSPNAARLSIRFFVKNTFGTFVKNIADHMERMELVKPSFKKWEHIPLWALLQETVSPNARVKMASPLMAGAVMQAILKNANYPASLFQNIMLRVKADQGNGKINYCRAAIIKAYLNKNVYTDSEGMITVGLNNESTDTAYVLGRIFSVLEQIQQEANPGINATIKDRYFDSACATPAPVFTLLLKLAGHHLRKLAMGKKIYLDKQLTELMGKIEMTEKPLPRYLSLEKQGVFILGYYHQNQKRYEKKEEK